MRKIVCALFLLAALFTAGNVIAGVSFIVDSTSHTKYDRLKRPVITSDKSCLSSGYTKNSCKSDEQGVGYCPYNIRYFKYCCPAGYAHSKKDCTDRGLTPSKTSCHGYYACE